MAASAAELTVATVLVAFAGVFLIRFSKGAFGGGFAIFVDIDGHLPRRSHRGRSGGGFTEYSTSGSSIAPAMDCWS